MKPMVFAVCIGLGPAALAPACSANPLVVGRLIEAGTPSACASAGGTCVLNASVACAMEAPGSAQDCSASNIPTGEEGLRCCFTFLDAGPDRAALPADAAFENGNGGNDEGGNSAVNNDGGGTSKCASVGGACLHANAQCATGAPAVAQDCNSPPNPVGDFCCLALPDASPGPDAGVADGGLGTGDGGNGNDSGGTSPLCAAAGGSCIDMTVGCALGAPPNAQDCPFPMSPFCCITKL